MNTLGPVPIPVDDFQIVKDPHPKGVDFKNLANSLIFQGVNMEKEILDIRVHVEDDFVYMSTGDWLKIMNFLSNISSEWNVSERKQGDSATFAGNKIH